MQDKKTLINAIVGTGTSKMSFDAIRFYETKRLVKYNGNPRSESWKWVKENLETLSVHELQQVYDKQS